MNGINEIWTFLCEHWLTISMVAAVAVGIVVKVRKWLAMDKEQRKAAVIEAVRCSMLALVTEAEREYGGGTGSLKRSMVLKRIFEQYPILNVFGDVNSIVNKLDKMIDKSLVELKELLESNPEFYDLMHNVLTLDADMLEELAIGKQIGGEVAQIMAETAKDSEPNE